MWHTLKRIEILLNHIRDKNNFINRESLFIYLFLFNISILLLFTFYSIIFQDYYLFHLIQYFKTFSLSHTKNSSHFHSPFLLLLIYIHMPTILHVISSQIHSNQKRCHLPSSLQTYNDTYITPTLLYYLILTRMSRL